MGITCPYCKKELDIMQIEMDKDLAFVFQALPSFGTRYSHLVMGYAQLFGVTPFAIKAKKLRLIIEEMKRLFDAQAFTYKKKTYSISHAGIAEALDIMVKRNWSEPLENHIYLKKVMMTLAEREGKDQSRAVDKTMKDREDLQRSGQGRRQDGASSEEDPGLRFTPEQRQRNIARLGDIIKSMG